MCVCVRTCVYKGVNQVLGSACVVRLVSMEDMNTKQCNPGNAENKDKAPNSSFCSHLQREVR